MGPMTRGGPTKWGYLAVWVACAWWLGLLGYAAYTWGKTTLSERITEGLHKYCEAVHGRECWPEGD